MCSNVSYIWYYDRTYSSLLTNIAEKRIATTYLESKRRQALVRCRDVCTRRVHATSSQIHTVALHDRETCFAADGMEIFLLDCRSAMYSFLYQSKRYGRGDGRRSRRLKAFVTIPSRLCTRLQLSHGTRSDGVGNGTRTALRRKRVASMMRSHRAKVGLHSAPLIGNDTLGQ